MRGMPQRSAASPGTNETMEKLAERETRLIFSADLEKSTPWPTPNLGL